MSCNKQFTDVPQNQTDGVTVLDSVFSSGPSLVAYTRTQQRTNEKQRDVGPPAAGLFAHRKSLEFVSCPFTWMNRKGKLKGPYTQVTK